MEALITNATKSEAIKVTEIVIGKYFINSPRMPGHNNIGKNANTVVSVEVITGKAISPIPYLDARRRGRPFSMLAYTLSTTTIPSSTSIPRPMIIAKSTMVFSVTPAKYRMAKAINIESGMAVPTKRAFFIPMEKLSTPITRRIPMRMWFANSFT